MIERTKHGGHITDADGDFFVWMKSLIPSYAGENRIVGNGEDINKKPPVIY